MRRERERERERGEKCVCVCVYVRGGIRRRRGGEKKPDSFASGFSSMMVMMVQTMALLYSNPPSSRSMEERKVIRMWCLRGNLTQTERMASTTIVLNSSEISDMKLLICFMSRSTLASLPVWGRQQ